MLTDINTKFSGSDILRRRCFVIAQLLKDHWEENSGFDTRFFDRPFIHDHLVMRGHSASIGNYREHIVPRVVIRDECLRMFSLGADIPEVRDAIVANLGIVIISAEEAILLDKTLRLKTRMPPGWRFGIDDPMDRFNHAGILITPSMPSIALKI